jgi:hypothetical protein
MQHALWATKSRSENRSGKGDSPILLGSTRKIGTVLNGFRIDSKRSGIQLARLALVVAAVSIIWLAVLPRLGRQPAIERYIQQNEALGIDPSAKFYTELPAMPALYDRVDRARRRATAPPR